jgi:uncharacterized membrane protein YfcA
LSGVAAFVAEQLAVALAAPPSAALLAAVAGAFVLGGLVKGLLGVGLPLVIVPLLALVIPSPKAIALMGIPIVLSNVWQAADSGHVGSALRRFGPLLAALAVSTAITARLTLGLPAEVLNRLVAAALLLAVVLMAWHPALDIDARAERRWGVGAGLLSGLLGGVSSLMGPVMITYLVALRLPREVFVGSISVIYLVGALPLIAAMVSMDVMGVPEALLSVLALAPMFAGMAIGRRLRQRVGEAAFRRLLLGFLTLVAILLVAR